MSCERQTNKHTVRSSVLGTSSKSAMAYLVYFATAVVAILISARILSVLLRVKRTIPFKRLQLSKLQKLNVRYLIVHVYTYMLVV